MGEGGAASFLSKKYQTELRQIPSPRPTSRIPMSWTDVFPVLTDEQLTDFQENADPEELAKMFEVLGVGREEREIKFGHILDAFRFGAPPHGGLDRIAMLIAFPKNNKGAGLMAHSPCQIDFKQLREVYVQSTWKDPKLVQEKAPQCAGLFFAGRKAGCPSAAQPAAIDVHDGAVEVVGILAGEENAASGDVPGRAPAAFRDAGED